MSNRVTQANSPLIKSAQGSSRSENIGHPTQDSKPVKPHLAEIKALSASISTSYLSWLTAKLKLMLAEVDDHLFDKSGKCDDSRHFAAFRKLRVNKQAILTQFKQQVVEQFERTVARANDLKNRKMVLVQSASLESLALVDDEQLEEQISIDSMVAKARKSNAVGLAHIQQRFEVLFDAIIDGPQNNPLDPSIVCEGFQQAINGIDLELEFKLVLYKYFERNLIDKLEMIIFDINQLLMSNGILTELGLPLLSKSGKQVRRFESSQGDSSESRSANNSHQSVSDKSGEQAEILSVLSELLAIKREQGASQATGTGTATKPEQQVETALLVETLSDIQSADSEQGQPVATQNLRSQIINNLPGNNGHSADNRSLGQYNDDMIDVVTMLFDFILDDENIHAEIKAVIGRLQIPILKVALVDKTFFSNRKHAARLLLNELAHTGLSWEPDEPGADKVLTKIQQVVEVVASEFNDDHQVFERLHKAFLKYKAELHKRATIFERRTREAEEGKARTESARAKVNRQLVQICGDKHLPEVVKKILKQAWSHVMFLESLKADEDSWQIVCQIAKLLVWSVQPVNSQSNLEKLTSRVPVLIKNLKLGFSKISFSKIEYSGLFDDLEDEHRQVIKNARQVIKEQRQEKIIRLSAVQVFDDAELEIDKNLEHQVHHSVSANQQEQALPQPQKQTSPLEIEQIAFSASETGESAKAGSGPAKISKDTRQIVESLPAGSWLAIKIGDGFKRCKLAAKIGSVGKYIFVNRSGAKVAEFFKDALCDEYQQGRLKILDDEALFDRALESVIYNLRVMKANS